MKTPIVVVGFLYFAVFVLAVSAQAQRANVRSDLYKLGNQSIIIPAPDGFTDVVPNFERIAARFTASESPDNEVLAVHVPDSIIPRLEKGEEPELQFYTKVSVGKRFRIVEINPALFAEFIESFQKQFDTILDPSGSTMTSVLKNANKGLNEHWGTSVGLDIKEPKNLGYFDKRTNVFSAMVLMTVEMFGKKTPLIASLSCVNVNKRVIYVYAYKQLTADKDVDALTDFTKRWTASIVNANKSR